MMNLRSHISHIQEESNMSSLEAYQNMSPKISFSADFLNEADFISITPNSPFFNKQSHNNNKGDDNELIREREVTISRKKTVSFSNIKVEEPRKWLNIEEELLSPRPPKCMVLWKELMMLRKQRPSASASSSLSPSSSLQGGHVAAREEGKRVMSAGEMNLRRIKKGMEKAKASASLRIRPMMNVTVNCTHSKSKNGRLVDK